MAKKPLKGFPKSDAQKMLDRLSAPRVLKKYADGGLATLLMPTAVTDIKSMPGVLIPQERNPYGFKPPTGPAGQALVTWINSRTGETWTANSGGWTPPSDEWTTNPFRVIQPNIPSTPPQTPQYGQPSPSPTPSAPAAPPIQRPIGISYQDAFINRPTPAYGEQVVYTTPTGEKVTTPPAYQPPPSSTPRRAPVEQKYNRNDMYTFLDQKSRLMAHGGEVQKYASGGLTSAPVSSSVFMLSKDQARQKELQNQIDTYKRQVEDYNKALEKYNAEIYNPYKAKVDEFNRAADEYNKSIQNFQPSRWVRSPAPFTMTAPTAPTPFSMTAPTAPLKQEEIDAFAKQAQERAVLNSVARANAVRAVQDPSRFNFGSFGAGDVSGLAGMSGLSGMGTPMFKDGGEVREESFASKALKEVVPLDTRTFVSTLFGNREPITEQNLNPEQMTALREVIQTAEQKGRQGNVQYSDYSKFKEGPQHNPHISLENTLGRFNYTQNPDGSITVTDRYDFVNPQREEAIKTYEGMGPARKALEVAKRSIQKPFTFPLTLASELGNAYIGREGRDVKIQIPPSESKKMLDGVKKPQKK